MNTLDQATLNIKQGLEPVIIVGIAWDQVNQIFYADADYGDGVILGKILNLPDLSESMNIDGSGNAQSITVKLDDSDGTILNFMNTRDFYLAPVSVYQWFKGYPLDFRAKMFEGSIVGPVTWNEGDRTVEVQCTTRFANIQVGYYFDETNTNVLHQSLIGKTWPLPFGTPIHYPALQLQEIPSGITTIPFGIPDPSIFWQIVKLQYQIQLANLPYQKLLESLTSALSVTGRGQNQQTFNDYWVPRLQEEMRQNSAQLQAQINVLIEQYAEQALYFSTHNTILGGFKFPQNEQVMCKIGDQLFQCIFLGGNEVVTNPNQACPVQMVPYYPPGYPQAQSSSQINNDPSSPNYTYNFPNTVAQYGGAVSIPIPAVSNVLSGPINVSGSRSYVGGSQITPQEASIPGWALEYPVIKQGFTWVSPGSTLTLVDDFTMQFLVAYVPGTVINVYAYKSYNGLRTLTQVPQRYYTITNDGNITYINMKRPLSIISYLINQRTEEAEAFTNQTASDHSGSVFAHVVTNVDWEDQLYVTFESSIGPNIVDILIWLITHYTPYAYDSESFGVVHGYVANYPANFVVQDNPLVDELMQQIAYQSRCSLILQDGMYYIIYLPIQPTSVDTITLDDIDENSLKISTTPVESLITRYTASWKPDYSPDYEIPNKVIIKNNNQRYGYIDENVDYFIYNMFYLVQKSALFWITRRSNVFKTVSFSCSLDKLNLQVTDTVTLAFGTPLFAYGEIPCTITDIGYNSETYSVQITCWTPVRIGDLLIYDFAWPAIGSETDYFAPNQLTTSGGSLGFDPGIIAPPILYNNLQKYAQQPPDYSDWPNAVDNNDFATLVGNPNNYLLVDGLDPPNSANERNTHIPTQQAEATTPVNNKPASDFSVPPTTTPAVPSNTNSSGANTFPGQIQSGSASLYNVKAYLNGLTNDPVQVVANEVHNDPTLNLDLNVWVTLIFVGNAYYIVLPSWSH